MAKQRFRDVKKGKVRPIEKEEKEVKGSISFAPNIQKIKSAITDSFMLLMPIMYIVFYLVMDGREGFAEHKLEGWIYILVPFILVQSLFMFKGNGQTPGYRNYNLKVVDMETLETPPLSKIVLRNLSMLLSIVTIFGWLMMFLRKDRRGLHDLLSGTAVIMLESNG
jgi:uncharacterized RDD family membrane protein YckC